MMGLAACGGDQALSARAQALRLFWEDQDRRIKLEPNQVWARDYPLFHPRTRPAEAAFTLWSHWKATGNQSALDSARHQLDYSRSRETSDHFLVNDNLISKYQMARLATGYFVSYQATGDAAYLSWADDVVAALRSLATSPVTYGGKTYNLYHYLYAPSPPHTPDPLVRIDPNQEASISLALTQLYFTRGSRFYQDAAVRTQALEHLDAAIALQLPDGKIPLDQDEVTRFDSAYATAALYWVVWTNRYWKEPRFDAAARLAIPWLNDYTQQGITFRTYPTAFSGPLDNPVELWWRLPIMYNYGGDITAIGVQLDRVIAEWQTYADYPGGYIAPTFVMELAGVPTSVAE